MHTPESLFENETKNLGGGIFEIQTDHLIFTWRPDQMIVNKTKKQKRIYNLINKKKISCYLVDIAFTLGSYITTGS